MKKIMFAMFMAMSLLLLGCAQEAPPAEENETEEPETPPAEEPEEPEAPPAEENETEEPEEPMPGSDRDEHGCIPSAGYVWCEAKQKCVRPWEEPCDAKLTLDEARAIAESSLDCMNVGKLTNQSMYNNVTHTWWFDLDVSKQGCSPACVVNEDNELAQVNWRCTGVIPQ